MDAPWKDKTINRNKKVNFICDDKGEVLIYDCSPRALERIDPTTVGTGETSVPVAQAKYPFALLHIGKSFAVIDNEGRGLQLRISSYAAAFGKRANKKFAVLKHSDLDLIEVARVK